jgi:predicted acylesterase/phospholipase RssA
MGETSFSFNKKPNRECDLVMKGGITSGVVYPPAVLALQQSFRFRSIGGTSAGAIAAAITAAAEYAREGDGFVRLDTLRKELASEGFLLGLFRPAAGAEGAFETLKKLFLDAPPVTATALPAQKKDGKKNGRTLASFIARATVALAAGFPSATWVGRVIGGAVGALPVVLVLVGFALGRPLEALGHSGWGLVLLLLALLGLGLGGWLGGLVVAGYELVRVFTSHLPTKGYFGLCRGYVSEAEQDKGVLTRWLTDKIDLLAGRDTTGDPLTFADLEKKLGADGAPLDIKLRVVTSNLSHGQPYVFPEPRKIFLFREDEMSLFFPPRVVSYLKRAGGNEGLPDGFFHLPAGDALPVVFATRLSLSFPILLSAVRLYTVKASAYGERTRAGGATFAFDPAQHFQESWFSDGGIASNFPIHFFDAWLPSRPTFGINLADIQPEGKTADDKIKTDQFTAVPREPVDGASDGPEDEHDGDEGRTEIDDVYLPHPRDGAKGAPQWKPVVGLTGFLTSIFETARNYRDTMQSMLPSYRERIVQVRLAPEEGGLNLAMSSSTIDGIGRKGRIAGEKLAGMDFPQHQWVRFRVLMAYLEMGLQRMRAHFPDIQNYGELFEKQLVAYRTGAKRDRWYRPADDVWCDTAVQKIGGIVELGVRWRQEFFGRNPPKPEASLRVTPPL